MNQKLKSGIVIIGVFIIVCCLRFSVFSTRVQATGAAKFSAHKDGSAMDATFGLFVCSSTLTLPASLPYFAKNLPYSFTFVAGNGTAPYQYSLTTGNLPPGLTLTSDGVLSGTPTGTQDAAFDVTVTDANGCTGTKHYNLYFAQYTITQGDSLSVPLASAGFGQNTIYVLNDQEEVPNITVNGIRLDVSTITVGADNVPRGILSMACDATEGSFDIRAYQLNLGVSTKHFKVLALPKSDAQPTVTYPGIVSVFPGQAATVSPLSLGFDVTNFSLLNTVPAFDIAPTIDNSGNLSITNTGLPGSHMIIVRATNRCGTSLEKTLVVKVAATCVLSPSQLSHWYRGEGTALDSFANGINGNVNGGISYAPGKVEQAFVFPGDGSHIALAPHHLTNNYSLELWVKPSRLTGDQYLLGSLDSNLFGALFLAGNRVAFSATAYQNMASAPIPLQQWTHVVMTSDESLWRLYINGVLANSAPRQDGIIVPARRQDSDKRRNYAAPSRVGRRTPESIQDVPFSFGTGVTLEAWGTGQPFQGMMDEIGIYDRTLTGAEINQLYTADALGKCSSPLGVMSPQLVTRLAGGIGGNVLLAVLNNTNALTVVAASIPAGMTVSNLQNNSGNVTADVSAACDVTAGVNYLRLQVSNGAGLSDTLDVPVAVAANSLAIVAQPVSTTICQNSPVTLSVNANSNIALNYQWRKNGVAIVGATTKSLNFTNAVVSDSGSYDVQISNACTSFTSQPAMVIVDPPLAVLTAPTDQAVNAGQSATIIAATSDSNAKVQWQVSMNGGQFWTNVRDATAPTLSFTANAAQDGNRFRAVFANSCGSLTTSEARLTVSNGASANTLGLVISEFRLRGNSLQPELDEYIELFNNTNNDLTVRTTDGSPGWTVIYVLTGGNSAIILTRIPNGTVIPAKGHYLIVNGSPNGYSLNSAATGDDTSFTFGIADDTGIAIFKTQFKNSFNATTVIDAVGFQQAGMFGSLFREGTGLPPLGTTNGEYAWVRRMENGLAIDTNNNANDFILVSPGGAIFNGMQSVAGAPGPENLTSPVEFNRAIFSSLLDPLAAATSVPNQVRDTNPITNGTFGMLVLRRTFTNNTSAPLKKLRFRVIDITNATTGTEADLRVLDSVTATINGQVVEGVTLEQPPLQTQGGGLNSTLAVGSLIASQPLATGSTVNVEFKLGVMRKGKYRFFLNIEAAQ